MSYTVEQTNARERCITPYINKNKKQKTHFALDIHEAENTGIFEYETNALFDDKILLACSIISESMSNIGGLRDKLIQSPESLTALAFYIKYELPEMRVAENWKAIAWKYLLRLDGILAETRDKNNLTILDIIDNTKQSIKDDCANNLVNRAKQIAKRKTYVGEQIARLSNTNLKKIRKKLDEMDYIIPEEPKPHEQYGYSFSKLCVYLLELNKIHNKIIHDTKDIIRFAKKGEELIGDLLDFHEQANTLNIIDGDEKSVRTETDNKIARDTYEYNRKIAGKNNLSREEISEGLRIVDKSNVSRHLRAIGRQGMADLASALGLVNGRENNPHHHCHLVVASHKKQKLVQGKHWSQKVGIRKLGQSEGISLWHIIQSKQTQGLASMYTIIKSYEIHGEEIGYKCFFGTLTNGGAFHSAPKSMNYMRNPNWQYHLHNLKESRNNLSKNFTLLRSRLLKTPEFRGFFGLKTFEFHKDGTPHIHFMFWLPPTYRDKRTQDQKDTKDLLAHHVEQLAPGHGHDLRVIENDEEDGENRASPTAYIMKYITKGLDVIDPEEMEEDSEYCKYRAMLSASGARAFSFVGCRGIRTLWNRLYNANASEFENLGEEWNEIFYNVEQSRKLWKSTKEIDLEDEENDATGIKKNK